VKQKINTKDKRIIVAGMKRNKFPASELNHLVKNLQDFGILSDVFGGISIELTPDDKKRLLNAIMDGEIDFDKIPDLKAKLEENFFLKIMQLSTDNG